MNGRRKEVLAENEIAGGEGPDSIYFRLSAAAFMHVKGRMGSVQLTGRRYLEDLS